MKLETRRGLVYALTLFDGPGRVAVNPTTDSLDKYLFALYHSTQSKSLLGVGGDSWATGAVKRSTYLIPRVARLVREKHAALVTALEDGINTAKDASAAEGAPSGRTTKSPSKQKRKVEVAELTTTVELLDDALKKATKSRQQAVRRAATQRADVSAAVERRAEHARAQATVSASVAIAAAEAERDEAVAAAHKQRDAAIARARAAEEESRRVRAPRLRGCAASSRTRPRCGSSRKHSRRNGARDTFCASIRTS